MNRGVAADSPRASRSRLTAAFRLCSKSTNVSVGPQLATQIVARHQRPRLSEQQGENAKRLFGQEEPVAVPDQLARAEIQRQVTETRDLRT